MKKNFSVFIIVILNASCFSKGNEENPRIISLEKRFNKVAQKFAYQQHFLLDSRIEMCNELINIYKVVEKSSPSSFKLEEIKSKIRYLINKYDTCSDQTIGGVYEFPYAEKIIKSPLKNTFSTSSCKNIQINKQIDWLSVYILTQEGYSKKCQKAYDLVEPHYSYEYKMRDIE